MARVVVTGGAGLIGSSLIRRLLERGDDVVCVEWGERFAAILPRDRLTLTIATTGPSARRAEIGASGSVSGRVLTRLRREIAQ